MPHDHIVLLTGITGTLGSWLASHMRRDGWGITALVRDEHHQSARVRIRQALEVAGAGALAEEVEPIRGDLTEDGPDLDRSVLPKVRCIVHCAACTDFQDRFAEISRQTNVEGTRRVLRLAEQLGVPMVHVSTAYVAGSRTDLAREDELDVGQRFRNIYEQTKCQAELLVKEWGARTGLATIILRPGIVVGDWKDGRTRRFNTLYDLMRAFELLGSAIKGAQLRIAGRSNVTKNIIPIDYFARAAWAIIRAGRPGVYHITHPRPVTLGRLRDIFAELFDIHGIRLVDAADFDRRPPTDAERLLRRSAAIYMPYMTDPEPRFDRTAADGVLGATAMAPPDLDAAFFGRLLAYARRVNWGRPGWAARPGGEPLPDVSRYFAEFLTAKLNQRLLPDLKRLTATFRIVLRESPHTHWSLDIAAGVLAAVSRNGTPAQCLFTLDSATFFEIVSGRLPPPQAFFDRRIDIDGDIEVGLKLAAVLTPFFRKFPFVAGG